MKRVRKYTYLPQEEIEVIETKSGETIKSKEILDGNYVKAKPAVKKVVKKAVKKVVRKKYDDGGVAAKEYFNKGVIDVMVEDFIKKLKMKGINATKRVSKNGVFVYGEKLGSGYKYETYISYSEVPNKEFLDFEMSEFVRLHKNKKKDYSELPLSELDKRIIRDIERDIEENPNLRYDDNELAYYAKGGITASNKKIIDFYINEYPSDELGIDINPKATFYGLNKVLNSKSDVYEYIGVGDSLVRERVFSQLANIMGVNYDVIYKKWLSSDGIDLDSFEEWEKDKGYKKMADGGMMDEKYYTTDEMMDIIYKDLGIVEMKKYTNKEDGSIDLIGLSKKAGFQPSYSKGKNQYWRKVWELKSNGRYYGTFFLKKDDPRYRLITEHGVTESIEDVNRGYELTISVTKEGKDFFENYEGLDANGNTYDFKNMAKGGFVSKGEMVWKKLNASKKSEFLYENFTPQITPRGQEILVGKDFQFLPKDVKIKLEDKYANVEEYADGGKVTDKEVADSNVEMLHSNIKSIKHHADELEEAIKDKAEIEGWVLAKADRAATAMSDITHYLDGRKMGNGGMIAGYYYKDKNGENLRYVGPDSRDENKGIFKDGDKYFNKSYNDFEEEPKNNKLFGFFGNGGYMPKGTSRKLTVAEKAEEMVGRNTWKTLDAIEKEGVIGELISDGALAITMEGGGIVDENDWNASSTDEKIYALKKAGYSNNMASELSLLPYEQVPMWVREDFRKGVIVIGDYHIHKNRLSSPIPLDMGYVLVLNGDEEVVFSAKTLEEAKEWANEQVRLDKEDSQDYEMVSDCCGAPQGQITDLCPECREHCGWEKMYYAEGGVTEAVRFKVIYKIKDAEPKEKIFDNAENAEFFLETIKEDDDIESANLVEVKPEKKAVEKKVTNLFAAAKPAATTSASKKGKEDVFVSGIADEITRYDALKAIIKNAEAEQGVIGDRLKEVGVDKFLELYELRRRNPDTFNLADEDKKIMFIVMDKYKKVEPEKAEMLANYDGLLETITTYKFNPELLDRTGEIVSRLIMESSELSDDEKANLIIAETKTQIQKGAIDRLLDYDNPAQIFTLIEPILALK